eukprot:4328107-Amphidinium_carterae.1
MSLLVLKALVMLMAFDAPVLGTYDALAGSCTGPWPLLPKKSPKVTQTKFIVVNDRVLISLKLSGSGPPGWYQI